MATWVRAGLVAGALSGIPSSALALTRGNDVLASTEALGAVVLPAGSGRKARILVGGAVHVALSLVWARVLDRLLDALLADDGKSRADAAMVGALAGAGIAALDLGVVGRRLPPIRSLAMGPQVADHLAYGALAGWVLKRGSDWR